jgi:hypothetical protein
VEDERDPFHPANLSRHGSRAADFLQVDIDGWRCGEDPVVTLRYNGATRREFSRRFIVPRHKDIHEPTHIFTPIYDDFQSLEVSDRRPGCVDRISRARTPGQLSVMLEVMLSPRWETMPLYQRLGAPRAPDSDDVQ